MGETMEIDNTILGVQLVHYAEGDKSVPGHVEFYSRHGCISKVPVSVALAAPDLLAALEEVLGIVQASIVNARNRGEYENIVASLERRESAARAAILKARGMA